MKQFFLLLLMLPLLVYTQTTLVEDDFSDMNKFFDLSLTNKWEPVGDYQTAFKISSVADTNALSFSAISLTALAAANKHYGNADGLRESTAFDYPLGVLRNDNVITLEFDILWKYLSSGGQDRRFVCALVYDQPVGGIQNDMLDSVDVEAPFGRPAYNFRLFNRLPSGTNNYANIFHGGGTDVMGEFEKFGTDYWIPGFISGPGGIIPESSAQYPEGPVNKWMSAPVAELNEWTRITLVVTDTTLRYYRRKTGEPASSNTLLGDLYTPVLDDTATVISKLNNYYGTSITELPAYYNYFNSIEAIRFFLNGDSTYIANVTITSVQEPLDDKLLTSNKSTTPSVRLYPVPATHTLHVEYTGQSTASILNMTGTSIKTVTINGNTAIPISDLPAGIYLMLIEQKAYRFIVQ